MNRKSPTLDNVAQVYKKLSADQIEVILGRKATYWARFTLPTSICNALNVSDYLINYSDGNQHLTLRPL